MRSRWLTRRALAATGAIALWAPGCLLAGWWQATVAMSGNALSYLYAVEWPVFAVLGVLVWWQLVHDDPDLVGARGLARLRRAAAARGEGDGATAADLGAADLGAADLGAADLGAAGLGAADLGAAGLGAADLGAADLGAAGLGAADLGAAGLGAADLGAPGTAGPALDSTASEQPPAPTSGYELELAEYNAYLASLRDRPKTWARR